MVGPILTSADFTFESLDGPGHHLVEDVVGSFQGLLGDDTGLLQQICNPDRLPKATPKGQNELTGFDVGTGQFTSGSEVDTDEFTLGNSDVTLRNRDLIVRLTKREELSLRTVLALPKASSTGLVCTTWSSRLPFLLCSADFLVEAPTVAKYAITFFVFSVLPAPDSPLWTKGG